MFELIFTQIQRLLEESNLFDTVYPIAETIEDGDGNVFPGIPVSEKEKKPLPYDFKNSFAYIKKNGKITINKSSQGQVTSCGDSLFDIRVPIKIVALVNKNKANCNKGFEDLFLTERIMASLTAGISIEDASSASLTLNAIETDRKIVFASEYRIKDTNEVNYNYSHVMLEYSVVITMDLACLTACNGYTYG